MRIHCVECAKMVDARLTDGAEIYPHRKDLNYLPFWKCDDCGNFVGCHHKTKNRTKPLGCIPNKQLKDARIKIHEILDPLWKSGKINRKSLYKILSNRLGWGYHTASIRSVDEAREVYRQILNIKRETKAI